MSCPEEVQEVCAVLDRHGLWHQVTKNKGKARSCPDAANKRMRLGHKGIPLFDELKSLVGTVKGRDDDALVMVHCRGHHRFDDALLAYVLGGRFIPLDPRSLKDSIDAEYGLVNPFIGFQKTGIVQFFDRHLVQRFLPPYTSMTNAGDKWYGVEFFVEELINALPSASVADLVVTTNRKFCEPKIGILTGNAPESGILLWERLNEAVRQDERIKSLGDVGLPRVCVESSPEMGLSMELESRHRQVGAVVVAGVRKLCQAGATYVTIACNTTQYFADECRQACRDSGAAFISIVDCLEKFLRSEGIKKFDLLGIGPVSELGEWSAFARLKNEFEILVPPRKALEKISTLAFEVKKHGITGKGIQQLRQLVNKSTQSKTVVIALTELSILIDNQKKGQQSDKRYIDTLGLLADELADLYLSAYTSELEKS